MKSHAGAADAGWRARAERLSDRLLGDRLGRRLARGALVAFAINILGMAVALLSQLMLARTLGIEGYGVYAYVLGWINLLVVPAGFGLNFVQLRYVAAYGAREEWGLMRGVMAFADRVVACTGLLCSLAGLLVVWLLGARLSAPLAHTFYVGLLIVPVLTLVRTRAAMVRAWGRVAGALAPDLLTRHLVVLVAVGGLGLLWRGTVTPVMAAAAALGGALVSLATVSYTRARAWPRPAMQAEPVRRRREWLMTAVPLLLTASVQTVSGEASLLMLGWLGTTSDAGIYAVAARLGGFVAFPLSMVSFVFAPTISQLFASGRHAELQRMVTTTAWWTAAAGIAISLPMLLFPALFLGLFGEGFEAGATALRVVLIGGLFRAMMGANGFVVTMTGLERQAMLLGGAAALAVILANLVLIPRLGLEGAAIGGVTAVAVWEVGTLVLIRRRRGIVGGILGSVSR